MKKFQTIACEIDGSGLATLTFNRPETRHALSREMVEGIRAALVDLAADSQVRALIFTGSGDKAFVSGADIAELKQRNQHEALRQINSRLFREVETFPHPTFAAIRGVALGGGLEFAMACDFRIAGESSRLGQPEVSLGILPAAGGCYRLARLVGLGRAKEIVLTARIISAAEGLAMGLLNRVVADAEVYHRAREMAAEVTKHSRLALQLAKATFNATCNGEVEYHMAFESAAQGILFVDPEKQRRMDDFLEKKKTRKD